jgi:hypothetical protein
MHGVREPFAEHRKEHQKSWLGAQVDNITAAWAVAPQLGCASQGLAHYPTNFDGMEALYCVAPHAPCRAGSDVVRCKHSGGHWWPSPLAIRTPRNWSWPPRNIQYMELFTVETYGNISWAQTASLGTRIARVGGRTSSRCWLGSGTSPTWCSTSTSRTRSPSRTLGVNN